MRRPSYTLGLVLYFGDLQVHEICLKEALQGHPSHKVNIYRVSMLQAWFSCFVYIDPNPHSFCFDFPNPLDVLEYLGAVENKQKKVLATSFKDLSFNVTKTLSVNDMPMRGRTVVSPQCGIWL